MGRVTLWAPAEAQETLHALFGTLPRSYHDADLDEYAALIWYEKDADIRLEESLEALISKRLSEGMGLLLLGNAAFSQTATRLLGIRKKSVPPGASTERVWLANRRHPILTDLPTFIDIPGEKHRYAPQLSIPCSGLLCLSMLEGRCLVRSGFWFEKGGRAVCLSMGVSAYGEKAVQRLLTNAVNWVCE